MLAQSLDQLATVSQCEAALKQAYKKQKTLQWKKMGLELKIENHLDELAVIETAIYENQADLMLVNQTINNIPEAPVAEQKKWEKSRTRFQYRAQVLEYRKGKLQPERLLENELLLLCIEASLAQLAPAILELETHKARLLKVAAAAPEMTSHENQAAPVIFQVLKAPAAQKQAASYIQKINPGGKIADPEGSAPDTPANKGPST